MKAWWHNANQRVHKDGSSSGLPVFWSDAPSQQRRHSIKLKCIRGHWGIVKLVRLRAIPELKYRPENQLATVYDVADGASREREKEERKSGGCLNESNLKRAAAE